MVLEACEVKTCLGCKSVMSEMRLIMLYGLGCLWLERAICRGQLLMQNGFCLHPELSRRTPSWKGVCSRCFRWVYRKVQAKEVIELVRACLRSPDCRLRQYTVDLKCESPVSIHIISHQNVAMAYHMNRLKTMSQTPVVYSNSNRRLGCCLIVTSHGHASRGSLLNSTTYRFYFTNIKWLGCYSLNFYETFTNIYCYGVELGANWWDNHSRQQCTWRRDLAESELESTPRPM